MPARLCNRPWLPWKGKEVKDGTNGEHRDSMFRAVWAAHWMLNLLLKAGADAFATESSRWPDQQSTLSQSENWGGGVLDFWHHTLVISGTALFYGDYVSLPRNNEAYKPTRHNLLVLFLHRTHGWTNHKCMSQCSREMKGHQDGLLSGHVTTFGELVYWLHVHTVFAPHIKCKGI